MTTLDLPVRTEDGTRAGTCVVPLDLETETTDPATVTVRVRADAPQVTLTSPEHDDCPGTLTLDLFVDYAGKPVAIGTLTCCEQCRP